MDFKKSIYVDGSWEYGEGEYLNVNPSDIDEKLASFSLASDAQIQRAFKAAKKGQLLWEKTGLEHKESVLRKIGEELISRAEEIGDALAKEEGKTLLEAKGEVYRAGQFFCYYAGEVLRQIGENAASVREGVDIEITREPVGVVGIISPWNFPIATAAWKIAPALAYGNAVIWKPSNKTPLAAIIFSELISRAGLPAGTFNLLIGSGSKLGQKIIESKDINALSFTGSVSVGKQIAAATAANLVRCQLEMGSKNALIIADDADINEAVEASIAGSFSSVGQKCTASSRLIVMDAIHDEYVKALVARLEQLKVGHYKEEGVFMGPVVDKAQYDSNFQWIERGLQLGARLEFGGKKLELAKKGYYMQPTLFTATKNSWDINQEEIFGPIACVIRVKDLCEAINTLNDTRFGLSAGIITKSLKNANIFKKQAKTGCVMINLPTAGTDYHVPFGGRKESSFGPREQGSFAKDFYTIIKTTYIKA